MISLTKEHYEKLIKERDNLMKDYNDYKSLTINDIWKQELQALEDYIKNNYNVDEW